MCSEKLPRRIQAIFRDCLNYFPCCQVVHCQRVNLIEFRVSEAMNSLTSVSSQTYAFAIVKFALNTADLFPYRICCDCTPLLEGESSMISSWARLEICIISMSAPHREHSSWEEELFNVAANMLTIVGLIFLP